MSAVGGLRGLLVLDDLLLAMGLADLLGLLEISDHFLEVALGLLQSPLCSCHPVLLLVRLLGSLVSGFAFLVNLLCGLMSGLGFLVNLLCGLMGGLGFLVNLLCGLMGGLGFLVNLLCGLECFLR